MMPNLPDHLKDHGMTEDELTELWSGLVKELMDPAFSGRTHHNRRSYDAGCKGPLCRKATRVHARRRNSMAPNSKFIYFDAILDYWHPVAVQRIEEAQQEAFARLTAS